MTTIAYDGVTMAADRMVCFGLMEHTGHKLYKGKWFDGTDVLAGFVGDAFFNQAIKQALLEEAPFPSTEGYDVPPHSVVGMLVRSDTRLIYLVNAMGKLLPVDETVFAVGSGCECAFGALAAGASAKETIEIVSERLSGTGRGVDEIRFTVPKVERKWNGGHPIEWAVL